MIDFDELIDAFEEANRKLYELVTAQEASLNRENLANARRALTDAIATVTTERDELKAELGEAEKDAERLFNTLEETNKHAMVHRIETEKVKKLHHTRLARKDAK